MADHPSDARRALTARVNAVLAKVEGAFPWRRGVGVILEALARFCDGNGWCFVSLERLREEIRYGYSLRHMQRLTDCAERLGLILRAVPRPGARLLGTATEYSLPWYALSPGQAQLGAFKVLHAKRRGPAAAAEAMSSKLGRSILSAAERVNPMELIRRAAKIVGGSLGFDLIREATRKVSLIVPAIASPVIETTAEPSDHRTPGPLKTLQKIPLEKFDPPTRPDTLPRKSDQGAKRPALGHAGFADRLRQASEGASAAVRARDARLSKPPLSEST